VKVYKLKPYQILTCLLYLLISSLATAGDFSSLKQVANKYKNSPLVLMAVEKIVTSELLAKESHFEGKISLSSGKFRWENLKPEKTLLVFDGETIWSEQSAPIEFPGPPQVAKAKLDMKNKSKILIGSLLNGASIFKEFKIISVQKDNDSWTFETKANSENDICKELKITINNKDKNISELSFKDDVGNKTTLKFTDIKFVSTASKTLFKYVVPKGAIVTNL
jgi:outer membrane lipoprotein carrier protein